MALPLPSSLSPSKISSFTDCPLAFRFEAIERMPSKPTVPTVKGTLVHSALERLMTLDAASRDRSAAKECLAAASAELPADPEWFELALPADEHAQFFADAERLVDAYFNVEDPTNVEPTGLELHLEYTDPTSGMLLRGIIDRLETESDGGLVVTDYKTGKSPKPGWEEKALFQLRVYALLYWQNEGVLPKLLQLIYLGDSRVVKSEPTEAQLKSTEKILKNIGDEILTALETGDFPTKKSRLCDWCFFKAICPAHN
jgi:putative RecB family exonuclease